MLRYRKEKDYISVFNESTGLYIRRGIDKNGMDTGLDPFMSSFPELLDVGIMGHCRNAVVCRNAGIECYQGGDDNKQPNMSVDDFAEIIRQCRGKTYQIALGGHGDPDEHDDFEEILKICKENGIVPNFTTSGFSMTYEKAQLCKKYCGAVAVSWQRAEHTYKALETLLATGVKTNIHYVISNGSIDEAIERLDKDSFYHGINAVVFLLHKPIGCGTKSSMVKIGDSRMDVFIKSAISKQHPYKIGFDSCTIPAILNNESDIDLDSIDTCEAARWSAYISPDMKMMPCSFDNRNMKWAVSLREYKIQEAWNSKQFEDFRNHLRKACMGCKDRQSCLGGCPICPEIVLCKRTEKTLLVKEAARP